MWWQQVPSADDIEEFVGADDWTATDFLWAGITIVFTLILARVARVVVRRSLRRFSSMSVATVMLIGFVTALTILGVDPGPAVIPIVMLTIVSGFAGAGIVIPFPQRTLWWGDGGGTG